MDFMKLRKTIAIEYSQSLYSVFFLERSSNMLSKITLSLPRTSMYYKFVNVESIEAITANILSETYDSYRLASHAVPFPQHSKP